MTEKIEPALSAEDARDPMAALQGMYDSNGDAQILEVGDMPRVMALANAVLPDSDPRKITRERIADIRNMIGADATWTGASDTEFAAASVFLDALASYLPPE